MSSQQKITEGKSNEQKQPGIFMLGSARIDPDRLTITLEGDTERVEARIMQVLLTLVSAKCSVVSRSVIEKQVWVDKVVTEDAVTNAIGKLRKILRDNPRKPEIIETISKKGYRLIINPVFESEANATIKTVDYPLVQNARKIVIPVVVTVILFILFLSLNNKPILNVENGKASEIPTIAVIPLEMLGEDSGDSYFADGITLDLITELSRIPGLLMIAPETSFGYGKTLFDDHAIAKEIGANYLIRGAVQRSDEYLRINIRIIDMQNDRPVWAKRFTGNREQVFQIQDDILASIAYELREQLGQSLEVPERQDQPQSIAAYDAFLHGLNYFGRRTPGDNELAHDYFKQAIDLDPNFARAYSGLALTMSRRAIDGWTSSPKDMLESARELADKALSIDPDIPQIHFVKAQIELFLGNHEKALQNANRAIKLNINYADAHALLAWILHYSGRDDMAIPALNEAVKRNPHSSASYHEVAGEIYFATEQYEKSITEFTAALNRNPSHMRARLWLAASYMKLGKTDNAKWEALEVLNIHPEFSLSQLPHAFPLKNPVTFEQLSETLQLLGLPE